MLNATRNAPKVELQLLTDASRRLNSNTSPSHSKDGDNDHHSQNQAPFGLGYTDSEPALQPPPVRTRDGRVHDPNARREMSRWLGQPSIKGSTESMRMLLLTCNVIGIAYVLVVTRKQVF